MSESVSGSVPDVVPVFPVKSVWTSKTPASTENVNKPRFTPVLSVQIRPPLLSTGRGEVQNDTEDNRS